MKARLFTLLSLTVLMPLLSLDRVRTSPGPPRLAAHKQITRPVAETADANASWEEVGAGSASGGGISDNSGLSRDPWLAVAPDGMVYVAWADNSSGNGEIYIKRWTGTSWEEVGAGSASGGGISNSDGGSHLPSLAVAPDGTLYVAWADGSDMWRDSGDEAEIYVRRWNGSTWEEVGVGSASGGGISDNKGVSTYPSLAIAPDGTPYIAWEDDMGWDDVKIYIRRWNGGSWEEIGPGSASGEGISGGTGYAWNPSMAVAPDAMPYVTWYDTSNGNVYLKRWNGRRWEEVGVGSASGGGISDTSNFSYLPSIAITPASTPYVAWSELDFSGEDEGVYIRRWNGTSWEEVGPGSASGNGMSDTIGWSYSPSVAIAPNGTPYVAWNQSDEQIYIRHWNGSVWEEVGAGSASGGGISDTPGHSQKPSLAIAPDGDPYVAWHDSRQGDYNNSEIYVRRWRAGQGAYSISGIVHDGTGSPVSGVTISNGAGRAITTGASGIYVFTGLTTGSYTLTPSKSGWGFTPSTRSVSVPPDAMEVSFIGWNLTVSHIEVTQVFRDSIDGVPLIEGKPTFARVYVDCGAGCPSLAEVTGTLRGYNPSGELLGPPLPPVNPSITAHDCDDWQDQRGDLDKTLNFTLPPEWRSGTVSLTAELNGAMASPVVTAPFQSARTLRVAYIPIRYIPRGYSGPTQPSDRIRTAHNWMEQVYPVAHVDYFRWKSLTWRHAFPSGDSPGDKRKKEESANKLLNRLEFMYALKYLRCLFSPHGSCPSLLFGWLPDGTYNGGTERTYVDRNTGRILDGWVAFGDDNPDYGQRILAHEVAHLLGRPHTKVGAPGTCGNPTDNKWSDWPKEYHDATIQEWGLDGYGFSWLISSPNALVDPTRTYDYMSYCWAWHDWPAWTSPWTYTHLYTEALKSQTAPLATQSIWVPGRCFIASGMVYTDDTAILDPVWVITTRRQFLIPTNPPGSAQYCLETQDAFGEPLVTHCFDLDFVDHETGEATGVDGFTWTLPPVGSVARIVLKKGSQELAVREVSANAPVVTVLSPNGGEIWSATGTYTITWSASDADGDPLFYTVYYSSESGSFPVGDVITQTQLVLDAAELPGGYAWIEVLASDGFNTSTANTDAFTVGRKPPSVDILLPEGDIAIWPDTVLWMHGYAYDLEDGVLEGESLQWSSDHDGTLGTGSEVIVTLSAGQHVITLRVTDSDGNSDSASVSVYVGWKIFLPSVLRSR